MLCDMNEKLIKCIESMAEILNSQLKSKIFLGKQKNGKILMKSFCNEILGLDKESLQHIANFVFTNVISAQSIDFILRQHEVIYSEDILQDIVVMLKLEFESDL